MIESGKSCSQENYFQFFLSAEFVGFWGFIEIVSDELCFVFLSDGALYLDFPENGMLERRKVHIPLFLEFRQFGGYETRRTEGKYAKF